MLWVDWALLSPAHQSLTRVSIFCHIKMTLSSTKLTLKNPTIKLLEYVSDTHILNKFRILGWSIFIAILGPLQPVDPRVAFPDRVSYRDVRFCLGDLEMD